MLVSRQLGSESGDSNPAASVKTNYIRSLPASKKLENIRYLIQAPCNY